MFLLLAALVSFVVGVIAIAAIGLLLPAGYVSRVEVNIAGTPHRVIAVCNDISHLSSWQPGVAATKVSADGDFIESGAAGVLHVRRRMLSDGFDDLLRKSGDLCGTRRVVVSKFGAQSVVRLEVERALPNVYARFAVRFVARPAAEECAWLSALARHLGEHASPQVLEFTLKSPSF